MSEESVTKSVAATAALAGLAGYAAYSWITSDPEGYYFDPSSLEMQTLPHQDIPACRKSLDAQSEIDKTPRTLYDTFVEAVEKYGDQDCFGWRSSPEAGFDKWLTYSQVMERLTNIGYGLRWLGLEPSESSLVGMFSKNRAEMMLTQLACYQHSMVIVPMYDTLGAEGIEHIVNQTRMKVIFCENEAKLSQLLAFGKEKLPHVTTIVVMDPVTREVKDTAEYQGWTVQYFSQLEAQGSENPTEMTICTPESLCLVCYTSGTTGKPKGAMITHSNLYSVVVSVLQNVEAFTEEDNVEVHYSYLPLAHSYEQMNVTAIIQVGGKIGFYGGDRKKLLGDLKMLRPTIFTSVPKIFNIMYDKVMEALNRNQLKQKLFNKALAKKEEYFRRGIITKSTIWDTLVFKRMQDALGGRVRLMLTGSAPISPPVIRFLRLAFGAMVGEGYGQTETSSAISGTLIGDYLAGEVGPPLPVNVVKLVDVPEMECLASENKGEICVKGLNVFKGYLYDEEKTTEALDPDGWLHTGDIGMWTERGTLKIVDRKKNIFKLSQGEYIAPERIENVYRNCGLISQCLVYGDSLMPNIVAIVVPNEDVIFDYAKREMAINTTDMDVLCKDERVKSAIMNGMVEVAKESKLLGFEKVTDIHLLSEPFSVENGLLTATFKVRRLQCIAKYKDILDSMYATKR